MLRVEWEQKTFLKASTGLVPVTSRIPVRCTLGTKSLVDSKSLKRNGVGKNIYGIIHVSDQSYLWSLSSSN